MVESSDNESQILAFADQQIRTIKTDRGIEWVAADVCDALGISDASKATRRFSGSEKGANLIRTPGGVQNLITVTEPGLYRLIMRSDKPEAERFREWVTHEVLPCIRKHGCYPAPRVEMGGRAVVDADMSLMMRTLGQEMALGMREAFNCDIKTAIDPIEKKLDSVIVGQLQLCERIDAIERRKPLAKNTQRHHAYVVNQVYSGKCPCCSDKLIVNSACEKLAAGEFDHWKSKALNDRQNTWLICDSCNQKLNNRDFRFSVAIHFESYQRRRLNIERSITGPMLPGIDES